MAFVYFKFPTYGRKVKAEYLNPACNVGDETEKAAMGPPFQMFERGFFSISSQAHSCA